MILQYVTDYLSKRDDTQVHTKPRPFNSCVSQGATFEFEIDIMDIEAKGATSKTRYALVAIDNFTKIADFIPVEHRQPEEMIRGLTHIFTSMGKPKQLYSDE